MPVLDLQLDASCRQLFGDFLIANYDEDEKHVNPWCLVNLIVHAVVDQTSSNPGPDAE